MLGSIEKALEHKNPFSLSVDSVLAIAYTYRYFKVEHVQHHGLYGYYVYGYRNWIYRLLERPDYLFFRQSADECWSLVTLLRCVRDMRLFNKLIKEVGIS